MANEKRLIDANVPIRDLTAMKSMYDAISLDGMIKALKEAPTVEAVEVVRCKNCVCSFKSGDELLCSQFYEKLVHEDDYCPFGERRTEYEKNT